MIADDQVVEDLIDSAYWLAHTYHVSPDVMLDMGVDEIVEHADRTAKMLRRQAKAQG